MIKERIGAFFSARSARELPAGGRRTAFVCLQLLSPLLNAVLISFLSLCLAFGNYDWGVFLGYLHAPSILLLNTLPVLLLELLLLFLLGRPGFAALGTALLVLLPSAGNYFKIRFRFEPFVFRDMDAIGAGLKIARQYPLSLNHRLLLVIGLAAFCVLLTFLCVRGRCPRLVRIAGTLLVLLSLFPLWRFVYSDREIYFRTTHANAYLGNLTPQHDFISAGFVYPFLFSVTERSDAVPENYDPEEAAALIAGYEDAEIPADGRVNLLVLQLESFTDLEAKGLTGVSPEVYAPLHALEEESLHGVLFANTFGGGTINSERCLLSGSYGIQSYTRDAPSHVRYLASQGYAVFGCHPNRPDFYNRVNVNRCLGFPRYDFIGTDGSPVTSDWQRDEVFLPEVFSLFRERIRGEAPVFSFDVSYQGHSPYNEEGLDAAEPLWQAPGASEKTYFTLNNYLSSVAQTQRLLLAGLDSLRTEEEPVLVLIYGDHNPFLNREEVYTESGMSLDHSTEKGLLDYYGTPWLLWANEAARPLLRRELRGEGPTLSPGYLLNVVFDSLGWRGSAFMQFTETIRPLLPVVSTNGYVMENGTLGSSPSEEARELLRQYSSVQFYLRDSYRS